MEEKGDQVIPGGDELVKVFMLQRVKNWGQIKEREVEMHKRGFCSCVLTSSLSTVMCQKQAGVGHSTINAEVSALVFASLRSLQAGWFWF